MVTYTVGASRSVDSRSTIRPRQKGWGGRCTSLILSINMGVENQLSHFLDATFSSVTHPLLAIKAVLDKFSSTEVQRSLNLIGQLPPKKSSCSLISSILRLHYTAFGLLEFPQVYKFFETDAVDD
ncbi:hypothetical protein HETIRDRAFT_107983 [Heterobasidion irregulare TC 32-1]|uniref:Uncharacterized protein n=1 Tax=Heterobasidion irregulare (strain TC 32-1) TaxID=747525 RepID=W4JPI9_HETIT|nr:uncharacterized protein HETIRDRAFT_107983 [Heterobasidion irregulare TC 32-1]ETW75453.1 hypothetical protein HETIRDRAFT_107983 [Heterobasidion irregulare TC 32-1]